MFTPDEAVVDQGFSLAFPGALKVKREVHRVSLNYCVVVLYTKAHDQR
jgi:hypothetical protein